MKSTEICDSATVEAFLEDRLTDALRSEFETHLSHCEKCRTELNTVSAAPELWNEVTELLGTDSDFESTSCVRTLSVLDCLAPTDDPDMLGRIGEYEITGVVGVGGMGAVLKGYDKSLRRVVAVKIMAPHLANSGSARTRFQREARAAAAITHDNVIDIYGVAEAAGLPYLVMPYARGPSLQKRLDTDGPLSATEAIRIGKQIASGLAAAHEQGLVHRDIKPGNILLNDGVERLWITDFGVARAMDDASMTQTGIIAGTPQFMSPEQARGETVDHRSDLFSLGAVLYTACTGRAPFRAETTFGILRKITDSTPTPIRELNPDIPKWMCQIVERLMAKHPDDRFESAREVADLLECCLAHLQQPTQVALPDIVHVRPEPKPIPANSSNSKLQKGMFAMLALICFALAPALALQMTTPPDISGTWQGENWSQVELTPVDAKSDWYSGTMTDPQGRSGKIHLRWSRIQRRYNGDWQLADDKFGTLTVRQNRSGELLGAVAVDPAAERGSESPKLRELAWKRASSKSRNSGNLTVEGVPLSNSATTAAPARTVVQGVPMIATVDNAVLGSPALTDSIRTTFGTASDLARRIRESKLLLDQARSGADSTKTTIDQLSAAIASLTEAKDASEQAMLAEKHVALRSYEARLNESLMRQDRAAAQLAEAQAELNATIKLLQSRLDLIEGRRHNAQQQYEMAKLAYEAGQLPVTEVLSTEQNHMESRWESEQLRVLLDYYLSLGQNRNTPVVEGVPLGREAALSVEKEGNMERELLEVQIGVAKARLESALVDMERVEKLRERALISDTEASKAKAALVEVEAQLQSLQIRRKYLEEASVETRSPETQSIEAFMTEEEPVSEEATIEAGSGR